MRWVAALAAAAACGRVGYDPIEGGDDVDVDAPVSVAPIHDYRLEGNLDDVYGGPALWNGGGTFVAGGYQFVPNAGLALTAGMPPEVYTIDFVFAFDTLGSWRKILDVKGLSTDEGLYTYDDHLQYVVVAGQVFADGATALTAGTTMQVTLTRDAGGVVHGYVDRVPQFMFEDTAGVAALPDASAVAHYFIDDPTTSGNESSGGVVRRIRIWDVALGADALP